ncbi:hypothetical protein AWN76_004025 [Rhodothermaceae bacterium RA]|nr:hypothetical protein AWN76_004025 [Rhodothermaceae bacterium RA]
MPDAYAVSTYQGRAIEADAADQAWRALWEHSPQRSPFSALAYQQAGASLLDLELHLVAVHDDTGWLAAALLPVRRLGPLRLVHPLPFSPFSALLGTAPPDEAAVHHGTSPWQTLIATLARRYDDVSLLLPPTVADVRFLSWQRWSVRPLYTYRLAFQDTAEVQARWSASTRRLYRREAARYSVQEAPEALDAVVDLCRQAYARHNRSMLLTREHLTRLGHRLQQAGMARTFIARNRSTRSIDAGVCVLHDAQTAAYWIAGSNPGGAMTVLLGHLLPWLRDDGLHTFDFVGANTPSIAEFKRRFGATLLPYYQARLTPHPLLRALRLLGRSPR